MNKLDKGLDWLDDKFYDHAPRWFYRRLHRAIKCLTPSNIWYEVKCLVRPYNHVRVEFFNRYWHDRCDLMFHAIFQLLVDYVELEQEFKEFGTRIDGRYTDVQAMIQYNETNYNPINADESWGKNDPNWSNDEYREGQIKWTTERYHINREIIFLYNWYRNVFPYWPELMPYTRPPKREGDTENDWFEPFVGDRDHHMVYLINGDSYEIPKPVLTFWEWNEREQMQELIIDNMLQRVLKVRRYLWT